MPELFKAVQGGRLFADSKLFVDAQPMRAAADIEAEYLRARNDQAFNLSEFVAHNFTLPMEIEASAEAGDGDVADYIETMWRQLRRPPDAVTADSSLLALPLSYTVPGGRFREIYYWDSYFTMLGLAASGQWQSVRNMVDNFAYLIKVVGHIPNGNRTYYLTRSQPPLFTHMVALLAEAFPSETILLNYLPAIQREYDYWMQGEDSVSPGNCSCRRVLYHPGALLNRYWDDADQPRQESYWEDVELAQSYSGDVNSLYRNIRAACETGWDFSSRWLAQPDDLRTVRTTEVVPVDLNCILVFVEQTLARAYESLHKHALAERYSERADARAQVIRDHFFCSNRQQFVDCLLPDFRLSETTSLATSWPLFAGVATNEQAHAVALSLKQEFLRPGGWVTTGLHTGQQWDAPNGWAPLQWVTFKGLQDYGCHADAAEGAQRWLANTLDCFKRTGKFFEKYNVESPGTLAGGGEYPVQHGFGWTNAVVLILQAALERSKD
nr:trehalase family glycosidase [Simiduia aestuariiviva]